MIWKHGRLFDGNKLVGTVTRVTHPETTPMNEPVWVRSAGFLDLMVPNGPPWVDRTHFGYIRKHVRKGLHYAHAGDEIQTFHELEEAKA